MLFNCLVVAGSSSSKCKCVKMAQKRRGQLNDCLKASQKHYIYFLQFSCTQKRIFQKKNSIYCDYKITQLQFLFSLQLLKHTHTNFLLMVFPQSIPIRNHPASQLSFVFLFNNLHTNHSHTHRHATQSINLQQFLCIHNTHCNFIITFFLMMICI